MAAAVITVGIGVVEGAITAVAVTAAMGAITGAEAAVASALGWAALAGGGGAAAEAAAAAAAEAAEAAGEAFGAYAAAIGSCAFDAIPVAIPVATYPYSLTPGLLPLVNSTSAVRARAQLLASINPTTLTFSVSHVARRSRGLLSEFDGGFCE